jgi:hypothetical protein
VGQRIFGLALGYEDLNDHDELRRHPTFAVLAGKLKAIREDCAPVAGESTSNPLEHTPKRHAEKYHKIDYDAWAFSPRVIGKAEHTYGRGSAVSSYVAVALGIARITGGAPVGRCAAW